MRWDKVVEYLRSGDCIAVQHADPSREGSRERYWLVHAGRAVTESQFRRLRGDLTPGEDGMFGDSQTYRMKT